MTLNHNELSKSLRLALAIGAVSAAAFLPTEVTFAQTSQGEAVKLDTISVTGSRLKRSDRDTAQPVFTISRTDIEKTGLTSIGDVLQRIAEAGPSINSQFNNGGDGSTTIDLRNLGSNRTLVLVNGRRWNPGLGGGVDLNSIPSGVIESIEVLKDGASAVYGSDAIAGVVNIKTRSNFEGATFNTFIGENSEGDGRRTSSDMAIGTQNERGGLTFAASYVQEEPIFARDRELTRVPNFGIDPRLTGSSTTPFGRYGIGAGGSGFDAQGRPLVGGTQTVTNTGAQGGASNSLTQFRAYDPSNDAYNFAVDNYLLTPQERWGIFSEGRFQLIDQVEFRTYVAYNKRKSDQELAAMPVTLGTQGTSALTAGIRIAATNPYNPFGADVTRVQRRFNEAGPRSFAQEVDTYGFGGEFGGAFNLGERGFDWDLGYTYSENDQIQTTSGLFNTGRIRTALTAFDADPGPGFNPVCGTPGANAANPLAGAVLAGGGCVPLNILGGPGAITRNMINYITFTAQDRLVTKSRLYYAGVSGSIFTLPAGDVGLALGVEHRNESGFDLPDAIIAVGETTGNSRLPTRGSYSLDEFYFESNIPLIVDAPFAKLLEMNISGRYSDYSNFGDTTNFAANLAYKPIDDLKLRASYNEGFRAPNILELFRGRSDNFGQLADICSPPPGSFNLQSAQTQANCRQGFAGSPGGVPATYIQGNAQIRSTIGGEPGLTPETSRSVSMGGVYSPTWLAGFDVSLDFWRIEIENVIGGRSAATLLTQCYRDRNVAACSRITRNPQTGDITELLATGENVGFAEVAGFDLGVGYRLPEFDFGKVSLRMDATYFAKEESQNLAFNPTAPFNYVLNNPINSTVGSYGGRGGTTNRIKAIGRIDWSLGDFSASWAQRYTSRAVGDCPATYVTNAPQFCSQINLRTTTNLPIPRYDIGGVTYHDLSSAYALPWNATLRLGINNAFDKDPPLAISTFANTLDPQYDVPGRFYYVSYSQRF